MAVKCSASGPLRIFSVTGIDTARTTAATSRRDGRRIGEQGPALAPGQQPADRALEVQIDDVEAEFFDHPRGGGQRVGVGAAELPGARGFGRRGVQPPHRPAFPPRHVRRVRPFADHQARPALLHQQAERIVAMLLQRGQGEGMGDEDAADSHGEHQSLCGG